MKITVVGTGYVGLVSGTCFANAGNVVTCLDNDFGKIEKLRLGESPFFEPRLSELMHRSIDSGRLQFTNQIEDAYSDPDIIMICVGTPTTETGQCDLSHVKSVIDDICNTLPSGHTTLVVVKSTVPVGTTHEVGSLLPAGCHIANNPEFLREGNAIDDFMRPDRIVCGVETPESEDVLKKLYAPFVGQGRPLLMFDVRSSEMVKYASNAMLACKISFINEIASLCERNGANIDDVRTGMCSDQRIGTEFFRPGIGYGGSCFPKDTLAVMEMGENTDAPCLVNTAVHEINQRQRIWFANRILNHFDGSLAGKTVAMWGLAFKPQTDDVRDAPSIDIARTLINAGATVVGYDPEASENFQSIVSDIEISMDMYGACDQADALVICTEWAEFNTPDFERLQTLLREPVIFDGRNMYNRSDMKDRGFRYLSVGRPTVEINQPSVPSS